MGQEHIEPGSLCDPSDLIIGRLGKRDEHRLTASRESRLGRTTAITETRPSHPETGRDDIAVG
jgi:hypothetical protein